MERTVPLSEDDLRDHKDKKKSACRNVRVRKKEHRYMIEGGDIYAYACVRVFVSVRHFFFFVQSIFHFHRTNIIVF